MKIDTVTMFTSEIAMAEINTLREEGITLVIPTDLEVGRIVHAEGVTLVKLARKDPS